MFKYCVVVSIVLLAVLQVSLSNEDPDLNTIIRSFVESRCGGRFGEFMQSNRALKSCIGNTLLVHPANNAEEYWQLMCTDIRAKIYSCLVTVLDTLVPCFRRVDEAYIPDFISGLYNNTFEEQCRDGNATTAEYVSAMLFGSECKVLDIKSKRESLTECFSKSSVLTEAQVRRSILIKDDLCLYLVHRMECLFYFLKENNCNDTYQFFKILSRGLEVSCNTYINEINIKE